MSAPRAYPVRVDARLDEPLSRWLWLVKWLLLLPHILCLVVLWVVFVVTTVAAFFAILFTGRYPRPLFDLNLGILRWGWRVSYYGNNVFGTDRYPPFTLADVPDYPARLDVDRPERLSRGLVLVKWWLLAIPHYLVLAVLVGGGLWFSQAGDRTGDSGWTWGAGGLVGLLAVVAAVVLLFTGRYPHGLFDLLVGLNRWVLRVTAYAALMTDEYPPFRLDLGGTDPGSPAVPEAGVPAAVRPRWTGGRVALAVVGGLLVLLGTGPALGGIALGGAGLLGRDDAGYLTSPRAEVLSAGRAVVTDGLLLQTDGPRWAMPDRTLGTVRIRVVPQDPTRPVFVGIAPTNSVEGWLAGSAYSAVDDVRDGRVTYVQHTGATVPGAPAEQSFWVAQASGSGATTLTWTAASGTWSVVVANGDVSPGVDVRADVAATVPMLGRIAVGLLVAGFVLLTVGGVLVLVAVTGAGSPRDGAARQPALAG